MFIVDTNVLSALRRRERFPRIEQWFRQRQDDEIYLSVITIGEIERGIQLQASVNPTFSADLKAWLSHTESVFTDRILDFDSHDARTWGRLSAELGHDNADLMIAASAINRSATVVTRNVSDFEPTGVQILNPFGDT